MEEGGCAMTTKTKNWVAGLSLLVVAVAWMVGSILLVNSATEAKAREEANKPPTYYILCLDSGASVHTDPGTFVADDGVFSYKVNGKKRYIMGGNCFALEED